VVSNGAGVTIFAWAGIKDLVDAPLLSHALIFGTIVVIVTEINVVALDKVWFIDLIVAVIIHAIALFQGRFRCIAARKTVLSTSSLARTTSHLSGGSAGSGQP